MLQPGRQYAAPAGVYRYGFNGKENDNEVGKGIGNQQDYGIRIYDPRIGKFLSVDPLSPQYPFLTPYAFAENTPIESIDLDGAEAFSAKAYKIKSPLTMLMKEAEPLGNALHVRMSATKAGVMSNLSGTYTFFTRDIAKIETWQNFGHLIDEILLSSSGQSGIYNPNTPILDSKVKEFKDVGLNGNVFERYKYWSELGTELATSKLIGKGIGKGFGAANRAVSLGMKTRLAASFYKKVGFTLQKTTDHLKGIDFSKPISVEIYKKGTVLEQWTYLDEAGNPKMGSYFALPGQDATKLGIPLEGRVKTPVILTEDTQFLKSTTADIADWTQKGRLLLGGETQLFQPNASYKIAP